MVKMVNFYVMCILAQSEILKYLKKNLQVCIPQAGVKTRHPFGGVGMCGGGRPPHCRSFIAGEMYREVPSHFGEKKDILFFPLKGTCFLCRDDLWNEELVPVPGIEH